VTVRDFVAANTALAAIHIQNIHWPVRIMLQRRQSFQQATASLLNDNLRVRIPSATPYFHSTT